MSLEILLVATRIESITDVLWGLSHLQKLQAIFSSGFTFWLKGRTVYSRQPWTLFNFVTDISVKVSWIGSSKNFGKYMLQSSGLVKLRDYSLQSTTATTTGQKIPPQILFWKCSERNGCCKFQNFGNFKKTLKKFPFSSNVTGLQSWFPTSAKKTLRKFFPVHFLK